MTDLKIFENPEFGKVRVILKDGEVMFVGVDVASILGYKEPHKAIVRHVDETDRMKHPVSDNQGFTRDSWVINESGLYSLIFSSELLTAKSFKKWVTSEVLPSIRKTGQYSLQHKLPQTYKEALIELLWRVEENEKLQAENKIMLPKAEFYDEVAGSDSLIDMKEVAKVLNFKNVGRNKLFEFLRNKSVLMRDNIPYQKYVDCGYFKVIEVKWFNPKKSANQITLKTMVYQKGLEFISKLLKKEFRN